MEEDSQCMTGSMKCFREEIKRESKEGREVGSVEKFTLSDGWQGKASLRRGHFSKDLMEGRVRTQWYLGGKYSSRGN